MRRVASDPERGAALLTVLMLVAVIAVMAAMALEHLRLSTRLAGNAADGEQARAYARAAEVLATTRVTDLLGQAGDRVTLAGGWSDRPIPLPLPGGGSAVARVRDGGNCFNLNSLVRAAGPGLYAEYFEQRVQFVRLMRLLGIPSQAGEGIAAAATDWIDSDQNPLPGGAEDAVYLGKEISYRTAGTLMADPSELRAVNGVTPDIYAKLRPWICTLPKAQPTTLNVNTLTPEQAPLVAMLFPDTLSVEAARSMIMRRPPAGFADATAFLNLASGNGTVSTASGQFAVKTTWFALAIDVVQGQARIKERALIDATRLPARLVARQWGDDL
ncbi:general secretion pathway protein GspK [Sphingomonas sp. MA1305]|uniref:type II secretion system minor pseudopilin GspK n=1 Tax=Sphingomonas sp. MA1305 TaxID=2479204 RepID=UPI0018DFB85E|nr:type II secretion system minor pseudopilin GspK [Sphingomonas sp. MA1305]MBI0474480.1 general secretion pathway protein GspK [Sphingomonas sp. MA1305]